MSWIVIPSEFDVWQCKVLWICIYTGLQFYVSDYANFILYFVLYSLYLKPSYHICIIACCQVCSNGHSSFNLIVHSACLTCTSMGSYRMITSILYIDCYLPSQAYSEGHSYLLSNVHSQQTSVQTPIKAPWTLQGVIVSIHSHWSCTYDSQNTSKYFVKYTSKHVAKTSHVYALEHVPNFSRWYTSILHYCANSKARQMPPTIP